MRILFLISVLVALTTAAADVSLSRNDNCGLETRCDVHLATKGDFSGRRFSPTVHQFSNAELLRRGLPLKKPDMQRGSPVRRAGPSSRSQYLIKITHRGIIRARNTADNSVVGYVSKSFLTSGQIASMDISNALVVSFQTDSTGSGTQLDLIPENLDEPSYGFLGLVQGRDDTDDNLAHGPYHYLYLAALTKDTPPGSLPVAGIDNSWTKSNSRTMDVESAVWSYDSISGALNLRWVNGDGSRPAIRIFVRGNVFYTSGDQDAFVTRYPASAVSVTFDFVAQ